MGRTRGKKFVKNNDEPMIMDAGFWQRNGGDELELNGVEESIKFVGGDVNFKKIKLTNGARLEGEGVSADEALVKNSSLSIKEAHNIKAVNSDVHVENFDKAKNRKNSTIFIGDYQLTSADATRWSGQTLPAALKTLSTAGIGAGTYLLTKDFSSLNPKIYTGVGAGVGALWLNSKINKHFSKNYTVLRSDLKL